MKTNIHSLSFHASDKLTDFTLDKVNRLAQYSDRIMLADVVLKVDKSGNRDNKVCEIRLAIPGNDLFASKRHSTFEEAVSTTVEALRQQLVSWKEKAQDRSNRHTSDTLSADD
jgi:putative sigma-54 modulation protein